MNVFYGKSHLGITQIITEKYKKGKFFYLKNVKTSKRTPKVL